MKQYASCHNYFSKLLSLYSDFSAVLPEILEGIKECCLIAIDTEFTGARKSHCHLFMRDAILFAVEIRTVSARLSLLQA